MALVLLSNFRESCADSSVLNGGAYGKIGGLKGLLFFLCKKESRLKLGAEVSTLQNYFCCDVIDRIREISQLQRKITIISLLSYITRVNE